MGIVRQALDDGLRQERSITTIKRCHDRVQPAISQIDRVEGCEPDELLQALVQPEPRIDGTCPRMLVAPVTDEAAERTEAADQKIDLRPLLAQLIRHEVEIDAARGIREVMA
ncbi:hypothetical protein VF09_37355 [Nostoc linckia z9]|nr:hypothetical protein VF09_37355 [Nostoc linckia z9]